MSTTLPPAPRKPRITVPMTPAADPLAAGLLSVSTRVVRRRATIMLLGEVGGELDLVTAPRLTSLVGDALADHRYPLLVLDLTGVWFLSAAGISTLLGIRTTANANHTAVRVVAPDGQVLRWLRFFELTETLDVHPTREQALSGHGAGAVAHPDTAFRL